MNLRFYQARKKRALGATGTFSGQRFPIPPRFVAASGKTDRSTTACSASPQLLALPLMPPAQHPGSALAHCRTTLPSCVERTLRRVRPTNWRERAGMSRLSHCSFGHACAIRSTSRCSACCFLKCKAKVVRDIAVRGQVLQLQDLPGSPCISCNAGARRLSAKCPQPSYSHSTVIPSRCARKMCNEDTAAQSCTKLDWLP